MTRFNGKINKIIGLKIRIERNKKKISQEQLGLLANLNKNSIGAIERGESSPTIETLEQIANVLEITLPELVDVSKINL